MWGPDKGSKTCPVCKYGRYEGILYAVGNYPDWSDIKAWLLFLENESVRWDKQLKVYFVYGNEVESYEEKIEKLEGIGKSLSLSHVALTIVPSFTDQTSSILLNKFNPNVKNTILIYRYGNIVDKYIDLEANRHNQELISKSLDKNKGQYYYQSGTK